MFTRIIVPVVRQQRRGEFSLMFTRFQVSVLLPVWISVIGSRF